MSGVVITKVDTSPGSAPAPPPKVSAPPPKKKVKMGGRGTTAKHTRTYPHGVLKGGKTQKAKILPVRDPARPPPRKTTLRILTEKGAAERRDHVRKTVRNMPADKVRETLTKNGLPVSDKLPPALAKEILESGMEAGMIVAK